MALWNSQAAVEATGGQTTQDWEANGVSIDTRTLQPGDLFVALKAARDGHEFVDRALKAGAAAALVTHVPDGVAPDAPLLIVDDVLKALENLGMARRAETNARIVAVTGSVGKTSTKEMLRTVLSCQGKTHASVASYNNHWGVPLTLARMPIDTQFGVFEVGMNHPGEIGPLSEMVRPHVAAVTTVAAAHLEAFEGLEGIAAEKGDIVAGLEDNGVAVLPADVSTANILVEKARAVGATLIGFGQKADAFRMTEIAIHSDCTIVQGQMRSVPLAFKLNAPGRHFASNAMCVLAIVEALGADPGRAAADIARWQPPTGRGTRETVVLDTMVDDAEFILFDDAYNANPTSMAASFEVVAKTKPAKGGRRIAFLGDMLELGSKSEKLHAALAEDENLLKFDAVYCAGQEMAALRDALPEHLLGAWRETARDMQSEVQGWVTARDIVLVKGSNGSQMRLVVDALRQMGQG